MAATNRCSNFVGFRCGLPKARPRTRAACVLVFISCGLASQIQLVWSNLLIEPERSPSNFPIEPERCLPSSVYYNGALSCLILLPSFQHLRYSPKPVGNKGGGGGGGREEINRRRILASVGAALARLRYMYNYYMCRTFITRKCSEDFEDRTYFHVHI